MREGRDLEFDVQVNVMTWSLALACLWRLLEFSGRLHWTATDWLVAALIPVYLVTLEFLGARRRAALADDWH